MSLSRYQLGLILVFASAVAWSLAGYFTRLIALDSGTMLAWRGIFGALGIMTVIAIRQGRGLWQQFAGLQMSGWLFALVSAAGMILFITSLERTSVAHVSIIYATVPFLAAALGWIVLRERPSREAVLTSLAALAGVVIMVGASGEGSISGDILAFGMTLSVAAMMVIARRMDAAPVLSAACLSALLSGLACWPFGAPLSVTSQDLVLLALFGLVNSAAGLVLFTLGAQRLPAIETALIGALDAPLAPFWVWLAFGETPGPASIIGGLMVFCAVGIHITREANRKTALATEGTQ
ncbi:MAG: hypothetical protein RLZZ444_4400 [Pseudomonadota bacterium]|jgi:drug/metabolite transporter (DMT)-like permease